MYSYNYSNVEWFKNPTLLDGSRIVVYKNKHPLSGVTRIYHFGEYLRICFASGYQQVYPKAEMVIEQSCLTNHRAQESMDYLKELAKIVSITGEDDRSILSKQYDKITYVSPNSVLAKYLHSTALKNSESLDLPIFPFGFNLSQKDATKKALVEQISVIEGPPGTGKTQTILNIIANAVMENKTVAVVSNNNSATANVMEKLQKYDLDFIAAYLGNKDKLVPGTVVLLIFN